MPSSTVLGSIEIPVGIEVGMEESSSEIRCFVSEIRNNAFY